MTHDLTRNCFFSFQMKIADSSIGYSRVPALSDQDHEIEVDKLLLSPSDVEDEELDNTNPKV